MSVYLLTEHRRHVDIGRDETVLNQLNTQIGEMMRWSCDSDRLQLGDTVYIIRLGNEPRGIIAEGEITRTLFSEPESKGSPSQKMYIQFRLNALRESCDDGLLSMLLLQSAMPEQNWNTLESVIEIKPSYTQKLADFWQNGKGIHSLTQYFRWYKQASFPYDWYQNYKATCELAKQIKAQKEITDADIKTLWYEPDNGIASVGQGFMYQADFAANLDFLREKTQEILLAPTEETYKKIQAEWKNQGTFKRMLWVVMHRVFAAANPEKFTSIVDFNYLNSVYLCLKAQFQLSIPQTGSWLKQNEGLLSNIAAYFDSEWDFETRNILLWSLCIWKDSIQDTPDNQSSDHGANDNTNSSSVTSSGFEPLNQILYGPPGTGKTHNTVDAAVRILDPEYYSEVQKITEEKARRAALKDKYDELAKQERIRFVTFHQSYGYEEFVEGLKANSESGDISYDIEPGVFLNICKDARKYSTAQPATKEFNFDSCWGVFVELLSEKEILEIPMSQTSFRVIDFNSKRIFFEKSNGKTNHTLSINTLKDIFNGSREYTSGLGVYYNPLVRYLKTLVEPELQLAIDRQNYVLIIDEINRGNISKIFGELITLIEPSKREGAKEALEVILPYSGDKFSVPDNLYLIGTMNTADRSLATMDTALRRRFDFIEMMPNAKKLKGCEVEGIQLDILLETLNQRIEVLYDREHTLGHAFFIPVKDLIDAGNKPAAFSALVSVFKNKIIPLLQEYFFEDWQKIRLVLGDNQRKDSFFFVKEEKLSPVELDGLFGKEHNLNQFNEELKQYYLQPLNDDVWTNKATYIGIYSSTNDKNSGSKQ